MEKITKTVLKDIVKECLLEILSEGLSSDNKSNNNKRVRSLKESLNVSRKKSKKTNNGDVKVEEGRRVNDKLNEIASSITSDPILSEMLMDTAHTTLQDQIAAEGSKSYIPTGMGDKAQKIVESSSPEDLFGGEAASKWATLAFNS